MFQLVTCMRWGSAVLVHALPHAVARGWCACKLCRQVAAAALKSAARAVLMQSARVLQADAVLVRRDVCQTRPPSTAPSALPLSMTTYRRYRLCKHRNPTQQTKPAPLHIKRGAHPVKSDSRSRCGSGMRMAATISRACRLGSDSASRTPRMRSERTAAARGLTQLSTSAARACTNKYTLVR